MKIAQIVCTYPPYAGGIGNSAFHFARLIKNVGHEITTFTPTMGENKKTKEASSELSRLTPVFQYGNGAFLPQLLLKLKKFDTIFLHYPFFGTAEIIWLYKLLHKNKKIVIHYHMDVKQSNFFNYALAWPSNLIKKSLLKQADIITCASLDYIENTSIKNFYAKNKNKFSEIPFGVDTNKFEPAINKTTNMQPTILFVGGLDKAHYFKGVDILLEAASIIPNKNWVLKIVGRGDLVPIYKKQAEKLKISNKVFFLDNISNENLPKIYQQADIFVLPSINKNEAFGLVLLEAMATGLPLIASDLPGVRKVFEDGQEGFLFKSGEKEALAKKIESLLNDSKQRIKMGLKARELALAKYDFSKVEKKIIEIFK